MATIQVTPELLRAKATEVRGLKGTHDDAMSKLTTLVNSLNEHWKGEAQTAFIEEFNGMKATFTNFSNMLEKYAQLMDNTAKGMEAEDQSQAATIRNSFT